MIETRNFRLVEKRGASGVVFGDTLPRKLHALISSCVTCRENLRCATFLPPRRFDICGLSCRRVLFFKYSNCVYSLIVVMKREKRRCRVEIRRSLKEARLRLTFSIQLEFLPDSSLILSARPTRGRQCRCLHSR